MITVLFVDDEESVLRAYKRTFRKEGYALLFAQSGTEALSILNKTKVQILITDIRMPEIDGFQLLKVVQKEYPDIMRIVVSGYVDKNEMLASVVQGQAHIYLQKPWDNEQLVSYIHEISHFITNVDKAALGNYFDTLRVLPELSETYYAICKAIEDEESFEYMAKIIETSPTLTSEVLHIVNSAFYNLQTSDVRKAIPFIGTKGLQTVLILIELSQMISKSDYPYENIIKHSIRTNVLFQKIYQRVYNKKVPNAINSVGLLHELGMILGIFLKSADYVPFLKEMNLESDILFKENELFNFSHDALGGYLLEWWNLPFPLYRIIYMHHKKIETLTEPWYDIAILQLADYGERITKESHVEDYYMFLLSELKIGLDEYLELIEL